MNGPTNAVLVAHGLGDAGDLPLPFDTVVLLAGGAVLAVAALVRPRPGAPSDPPADPAVPEAPVRPAATPPAGAIPRAVLRGVSLAVLAVLLALAVLGPNDPTVSPVARIVYGVFWPLLLLSSIVLGNWWSTANPLRALAAWLARLSGDPDDATARPPGPGVGLGPAAALLAVFVWGAVVPAERPHTAGFIVAAVVLAVLTGTLRHGRTWVAQGDPLEAYAGVLARLSPVVWRRGRPLLESPRARLAAWSPPAGFLALVAVGIGADVFDGVSEVLAWQNLRVGLPPLARALVDTAGLAGATAVVYGLGRLATRRARELLPALVPVAGGYAAAHYLAVAPIDAQVAFAQLSDPLGRGWNLLGVTTTGASYDIVPGLLAALVVLAALLAGHIAAVVVANDCAARHHGPRTARMLQVPLRGVLIVSMIASVFVRFGGG